MFTANLRQVLYLVDVNRSSYSSCRCSSYYLVLRDPRLSRFMHVHAPANDSPSPFKPIVLIVVSIVPSSSPSDLITLSTLQYPSHLFHTSNHIFCILPFPKLLPVTSPAHAIPSSLYPRRTYIHISPYYKLPVTCKASCRPHTTQKHGPFRSKKVTSSNISSARPLHIFQTVENDNFLVLFFIFIYCKVKRANKKKEKHKQTTNKIVQ